MFCVGGHAQRVVGDLVFCLGISLNLQNVLSFEIAFLGVKNGLTLDLNSPVVLTVVFQSDFLFGGGSHHRFKFDFLHILFGLLNAFA